MPRELVLLHQRLDQMGSTSLERNGCNDILIHIDIQYTYTDMQGLY